MNTSRYLVYIVIVLFMLLGMAYSAHAADVALVVKDVNSISNIHEKPVNNILTGMSHSVTLIDKNTDVNYSDFDLIVVAGRPCDTPGLDDFVANIPVNDIPTIAIDYYYLDEWGWAKTTFSVISSQKQKIKIEDMTHPVVSGFSGTVEVHTTRGKEVTTLKGSETNLNTVATNPSFGSKVIAYAEPNFTLLNGNKTKARIVFFGIQYPYYWTGNATQMFMNAVDWAINDYDNDGIRGDIDNCPDAANPGQEDNDSDGAGDVCDTDDDNDGVTDGADNCPLTNNPDQADTDSDGLGDACDTDDDNDGILDADDNCPSDGNGDQNDNDNDGIGDACDTDDDNDGVADTNDNCPIISNADQADTDSDGTGNVCDADDDNDGINDVDDNCQLNSNPDQADNDSDGLGDVCDADDDADGVNDVDDNCPLNSNADQTDNDSDGSGDVCDTDDDNDDVNDTDDNCPLDSNTDQSDNDSDGQGDVCDTDDDNDNVLDANDNCPINDNPDQNDNDNDGIGDVCDNDDDNDSIADATDNCPLTSNTNQTDTDTDGQGDICDADDDNDGINDVDDNCQLNSNPDQADNDDDGIGDVCDTDDDNDGIADADDNCPQASNPGQEDNDSDGQGDVCDDDDDNDTVLDENDNCPLINNTNQTDSDGDGIGFACDNFVYNSTCMDTNVNLTVRVGNSTNMSQAFSGVHDIGFFTGNDSLVKFEYNLSEKIDFCSMKIESNTDSGAGSIVVEGINLQENQTKTVYVDRILNANHVCIKDMNITNITEISAGCSGANETLVECDGSVHNSTGRNYTCTLNRTRYMVTGLLHSGVKQQATCNDGIQNQGETGVDCGGICAACPVESSGGGGGSSGGSSGGGSIDIIPKKEVTFSVPDSLNMEKDSEYTLTISVKNTGNMQLGNVNLRVEGIPEEWFNVTGGEKILKAGQAKMFNVVLKPDKTGSFGIDIVAYAGSTLLSKKSTNLYVYETSAKVLDIIISEFVLPDLPAGESGIIRVQIWNKGSAVGSADISVFGPAGWINPDTETDSLSINEAKNIGFNLSLPVDATDTNLTARVSFVSGNETKTVEETKELKIKQPGESGETDSVTGLFTGFDFGSFDIDFGNLDIDSFAGFLSGIGSSLDPGAILDYLNSLVNPDSITGLFTGFTDSSGENTSDTLELGFDMSIVPYIIALVIVIGAGAFFVSTAGKGMPNIKFKTIKTKLKNLL